MTNAIETDVLVLGSGISGALSSLLLADQGLDVLLVTRASELSNSNTNLAQGGIAYRGDQDSPSLFVSDMMRAGANYCNLEALSILAEEGPGAIRELLFDRLNIRFDESPSGRISLAREASHSVNRVLHSTDATGLTLSKAYIKAVISHPKIKVLKQHTAVDLLTPSHHSKNIQSIYNQHACVGAYLFDQKENKITKCMAKKTILATGGLGEIYLRTSNPVGARGDGLAMAYRMGARIINNEFVQFHPTTFFKKDAPSFLISEALRGAGAKLVHEDGSSFMHTYDEKWQDLAPRDVVSRSIYQEMVQRDISNVYLDLRSYLPAEEIKEKFPHIYQNCLNYDVDISKDLIPVVPAAHYACGGVWSDAWAKTSVENLYAIGEVSCNGVHGANRLASTSLLEGVVWARRAAINIQKSITQTPMPKADEIPEWESLGDEKEDPVLMKQDFDSIKNIMWNYVGLIRSSHRLGRAFRELKNLESEIEKFYRRTRLSDQLLGMRNAVKVALIVTTSAWKNKKSIGCHYIQD